MTRSGYFRPVSGGISGLCVEPDDNPLSVPTPLPSWRRRHSTSSSCTTDPSESVSSHCHCGYLGLEADLTRPMYAPHNGCTR